MKHIEIEYAEMGDTDNYGYEFEFCGGKVLTIR